VYDQKKVSNNVTASSTTPTNPTVASQSETAIPDAVTAAELGTDAQSDDVADDNALTFEDATCELCGRAPTEHLLTTHDMGWRAPGEFSLVRCTHCDLIITTPRPVPASMPRYYADWYSHKTLAEQHEELRKAPYHKYVKWMRLKVLEKTGRLQQDAKVLDVGGGFGAQLEYYMDRRGMEATLLDFDPAVTENAMIKDRATIMSGDLLDADLPENHFDLVTLYETLEHVYQPKATLEAALRVLKPGGRLVVEVPDYGSPFRKLFGRFWFATMVPVHLHHFTKPSLQKVVKAAGFEPLRHVAVYTPFETSASIAVRYCEKRGLMVSDVTEASKVFKPPYKHVPFFLALAIWTGGFDFPWQFWAWLCNKTGVQALIARKPE